MNKITVDKSKMEMLSRELGKLQCWLTGYHAGAGHKPNQLGIHIPGEDAVRQTKLLFRDMIQEAEAADISEAVPEGERWIEHKCSGIMPCSKEAIVEIRLRDGDIEKGEPAEFRDWVHNGDERDIVAWRLAK